MKFFKCPCCAKLHFTRLNGIQFENNYETLQEFTIKKRLKCGKCHNNLAVLTSNNDGSTKVIWEEYYKISDDAAKKLNSFQKEKDEIIGLEDGEEKQSQLEGILKKIREVQNQVSTAQSKLRIKARVITPDASMGMSERLSGL